MTRGERAPGGPGDLEPDKKDSITLSLDQIRRLTAQLTQRRRLGPAR